MNKNKIIRAGKSLASVGGAALLFLFASVPGTAQTADQACVYQNTSYGGVKLCLSVGAEIGDLTQSVMSGSTSWNDQISSVKVGFNTKIVLWQDINFQGKTVTLQYDSCNNTSPAWSTMPSGWNDKASSIRVMACDHPVPEVSVSSNQVIFYEDRDYGGQTLSYEGASDVRDLTQVKTNLSGNNTWNDRISAIAIGSSMKVIFYKDIKCPDTGDKGTLTISSPCLVPSGWNDKISSFKILFK